MSYYRDCAFIFNINIRKGFTNFVNKEFAIPCTDVFEPIDIVDEPIMTMINPNTFLKDSYELEKVKLDRKKFCMRTAEKIAAILYAEITKNDTDNGY